MKTICTDFSVIADYYRRHYEEVRLFVAKRLMQHGEEAEDIVQNVFLKLMTADKMITPVTLPCLVYTTARNLICDYWRHRHYVDNYEHYIKSNGLKTTDDNPMSVCSVAETQEFLEQGIARLTVRQQRVYRLHIYQGMKVSEISKTLAVKYKSVEHCLGDARKGVREFMKRELA
ncbi:RNA polymerase sigma factor [Segatella oris]|jgi:RNA polymerase sigma factor, sigma-70 family|uniref:RNA polymerase sigma-M factor n=1 Tax=Segatella oris C735 TaxID=563008 RepID=D7NAR4_9BACT|nr:sigma-70 family RNA polymerase sigma factor [Segatella oris]EFI49369.1 RNA polymerase sigma-M factor [Segatella oris C735]